MPARTKIKITDDVELRKVLEEEYETSSQIELCKYALSLATHILSTIKYDDMDNSIIQEGFGVNEKWQNGNARQYDVRQVGFQIHRLARNNQNIVTQTALRVVGQTVATGHMPEHAMVASDYAIKTINLLFPKDDDKVRQERLWQIAELKSIKNTNC